jgi:hypothetical protein
LKPLAIDLCCGLGGWTDGLLVENWQVVGFDVERHKYGSHQYPAQLVLQDILTLDGRQFRGKVSLIVASPPCQKYSYMAMPWTRAKELVAWYRDPEHPERIEELNALFNACVRIGREAECPIVIENVRGIQPWVGRSRWNYGSYHLFGDVPALMPIVAGRTVMKDGVAHRGTAERAIKNNGGSWFSIGSPGQKMTNQNPVNGVVKLASDGGRRTDVGKGARFTSRDCGNERADGVKQGGDWFNAEALDKDGQQAIARRSGSKSNARKAASARIAMIPLPLARHIARVYYPSA